MKNTNIYVADLEKPDESVPVIASTRMDQNPSVSPDGKRILFESNRSGHDEIWVSDVNGANAVALTAFEGAITGSPRWSPDGSQIAFDSGASGHPEIYVMDTNGGNRRQLTRDGQVNLMPCWSADGKWIYFTSLRSGNRQIWKMPSGGGPATAVTQGGGTAAVASSDGRWIWYMKTASPVTSLWRVPAEGGAESGGKLHLLHAAHGGHWLRRSGASGPGHGPDGAHLEGSQASRYRAFVVAGPSEDLLYSGRCRRERPDADARLPLGAAVRVGKRLSQS